MCGIVGIAGTRDVAPIILEALKRLEYRGYDSAGIATLDPTGRVRERVPDRGPAPVQRHRSLDLVRGRCRAPDEAGRKRAGVHGRRRSGGHDEFGGHPLTAPCMIPPTMCLPSKAKTMRTGRVP